MSDNPHDLARFVSAQDGVFEQALTELRAGAKRSHWMWFVFPQIAGLGQSAMARHYAIRSLDEAQAYFAHPVLGLRYDQALKALAQAPAGRSAEQVMGEIDTVKLRSSLTLFARAGAGTGVAEALSRWFGGEEDGATLRLLATV